MAKSANLGTTEAISSSAVRCMSRVVPIRAVASASRVSRSWARAARASARNRSVTSMIEELTPSTCPAGSARRK